MKRMVSNQTIQNFEGRITALEQGTDAVSGTNNGTNWTSITINEDTYNIPQGTQYTAGTNINISSGVISATDTTYTAGDNIDITNGAISLDTAISVNTLEAISSITTDFLATNYIELAEGNIQFLNAANIRSLYVINDDKPFEISTYTGSNVTFSTNGLVSIRTKDGESYTTYTFKADGIYIGDTKITN